MTEVKHMQFDFMVHPRMNERCYEFKHVAPKYVEYVKISDAHEMKTGLYFAGNSKWQAPKACYRLRHLRHTSGKIFDAWRSHVKSVKKTDMAAVVAAIKQSVRRMYPPQQVLKRSRQIRDADRQQYTAFDPSADAWFSKEF